MNSVVLEVVTGRDGPRSRGHNTYTDRPGAGARGEQEKYCCPNEVQLVIVRCRVISLRAEPIRRRE